MARRQGGTLGTFTPLSTPNAPTGLSVSAGIGSATVSFTAPTDTGDDAVTSYIVTAIDESTSASSGTTGSASPITISLGGGTFKIRAQAVNGFGPGRLTEFSTGNSIFSGAEIYSWGGNNDGQLGLGDSLGSNRSSPVQIGALTTWAQFSSNGGKHSLAVGSDGKLYAWGDGTTGRLGLGNVTSYSVPTQLGALTTWSQSACGGIFSVALKTDGTIWSWGGNNDGQLGHNDTVVRSSPVQIGALTNWISISTGDEQAFSITASGELYSWGNGGSGRLGTGSTDAASSPVQVGALNNWYKLSTGSSHVLSIKTDGTLWAWGNGYAGELGTGNKYLRSSPVQVGALTTWTAVATGDSSSRAISAGALFVFGDNRFGELGLNNSSGFTPYNRKSSPTQVGASTAWTHVQAGARFTAAINSGALYSWGLNTSGQVGDNTVTSRSSPVQIGAGTSWGLLSSNGGGNGATAHIIAGIPVL
jgi:alpha-tubulin suppressor-like RCC1 family protein